MFVGLMYIVTIFVSNNNNNGNRNSDAEKITYKTVFMSIIMISVGVLITDGT